MTNASDVSSRLMDSKLVHELHDQPTNQKGISTPLLTNG